MNGLDYLIFSVVALAAVRGLRRGFGREVIGLGAAALLLLCGLPLSEPLGRFALAAVWPKALPYAPLAGFLLLTLLVGLLVAVLSRFWADLIAAISLTWVDAAAGALFGAAKTAGIWLVIVAILSWIPAGSVRRTLAGSVSANALLRALPRVYRQVDKLMPPGWALPRPAPDWKRKPRSPEPPPESWRQVREGRQA